MLLYLGLGAIVNVLMAWALSLWSPILRSTDYEQQFPRNVWWSSEDLSGIPLPVNHQHCVGVDMKLTGADLYFCVYLRSGIPFRSLEHSWEYLEGGIRTRTLKDGTVIIDEVLTNWCIHVSLDEFDPLLFPAYPSRKHVPLRPIWHGFLLNSFFYGFLLWLVVPILVRSYRRFRGRCVECRYNLTGNTSGVCPECGAPIKRANPA